MLTILKWIGIVWGLYFFILAFSWSMIPAAILFLIRAAYLTAVLYVFTIALRRCIEWYESLSFLLYGILGIATAFCFMLSNLFDLFLLDDLFWFSLFLLVFTFLTKLTHCESILTRKMNPWDKDASDSKNVSK